MTREIKVNDHKERHGNYKGISFEIVKWQNEGSVMGYTWNFYLIVKPRRMKTAEGFREGERRVDYLAMYGDVQMHGEITFWQEIMTSRKKKVHKIGCEYAHSFDMEYNSMKLMERTLKNVLNDVKEAIDKLPEDLKVEAK